MPIVVNKKNGLACTVETYSTAQLHHARSFCLNPTRASRYRQVYSSTGTGSSTSVTSSLLPSTSSDLKSHQLRRSRSQCTSRMMRTLTSVASIDDSASTSGFQVPSSPGGGSAAAAAVTTSSTAASGANRHGVSVAVSAASPISNGADLDVLCAVILPVG